MNHECGCAYVRMCTFLNSRNNGFTNKEYNCFILEWAESINNAIKYMLSHSVNYLKSAISVRSKFDLSQKEAKPYKYMF